MTVADVLAGPVNDTVTVWFCAGYGSDTVAVQPAAKAGDAVSTTGTARPSARTPAYRTRTVTTVTVEGVGRTT